MPGADAGVTVAEKIRESADTALYRGHRRPDGRAVLVKSPRGGRPTPTQLARLRHEQAILGSLRVPGVVESLGIEDLDCGVALVMADPGRTSLDHLVGPRRLDVSAFLCTAIAMAEAVEAVHRQRIIHRNIRPENFFRDDDTGRITLIDFGAATRLALEARGGAQVGRFEGDLAYMSPEQTGRMNRSVDRRADLYSLGVALYQLGTGILPFQTTDPLELLHSHIACSPVPPHVVRPDWPRILSEIVMRLLAKNAEDRYQDISGLKADLLRCQEILAQTGTIPAFTLGEKDFCDELRIPQKLYGRESDLARLFESFEHACQGGAELLLLSGYSGVGKSVLVGELHRQIATGARIASGKFDPIGRRIPYAPILQACGEMLRSILAEPPGVLAQWRQRLLATVGSNGRVVSDIIPELSLLLGTQPPVEVLDPAQSQHRFEATFLSFLQGFAAPEHPLVLFLDDLQWADAASLRMLHLLLTAPARGFLLVIGAYRDNEVDSTHPLAGAIADLRRTNASIAEIKLQPLDGGAIERLLADTFATTAAVVRPLAKVVLDKTEGNPFFLGQFLSTLYRDGLVAFDASRRQWIFRQREIEQAMVTDNVVDFIVERLQRLPQETQDLLRIAACIGHQFDRRSLALVAERSAGDLRRDLWHALHEGLVVPLDVVQAFLHEGAVGSEEVASDAPDEDNNPSYRFLHDRVHQAAYATLAERQRQEMHLRIGQMQLAAGGSSIDDRQLFAIVNHLNLGAGLVGDATDRNALAKLNFSAANKAKDAAAHATAIRHLDICSALLGDNAWRDDYDTAFQADICRAECEIATGRFDSALCVLDRADAAARDDLDQATALALRILVFVSMNRMGEAIDCGIRAARVLGEDFPGSLDAIGPAIGAELGAIFATLGPRGLEGLLALPRMTDKKSLLLLQVLHRIMPAAATTDPALMTLIVARAVHLSLRQGNAPLSAYFCASFAHVHIVMGDVKKAHELGRIAIRLNQSLASQAVACAVHFMLGAFVTFWSDDVAESVEHLRKGLQAALDAGDYLYACYCAMGRSAMIFQTGQALEEVAGVAREASDLIDRTGDVVNRDLVRSLRRIVDRLKASSGPALESDEAEAERKIIESHNPYVVSCHFAFRAVEKYLAGDSDGTSRCLARTRPSVPGNFAEPQTHLYEALLLAEQVRSARGDAHAALAELRSREAAFRRWASDSPKTFACCHALVAAELGASTGDDGQAFTRYEEAIQLAQDGGAILYEALACELAGRYAERRGWSQLAREHYLRNASTAYARWGDVRKARQLAAGVPEPSPRARASTLEMPAVGWTGEVRTDNFDALALARATQAISGEIVPAKLMARLMMIAIEQAGAERGFLLLLRGGELWVECAAGVPSDDFSRCRLPTDAELDHAASASNPTAFLLPRTVISFVAHTREKVVLTQASEPNRFASDPYLAEHKPRSLLCMPMIRQGELTGLLYLENRLAADVFSADQVELLEVLSTQAAISLENARLYEEMEERVRDRTRKLEESLRTIREDQAMIIEAERRAAVAHLESELAIARKIQTSILPKDVSVAGMEIAATMRTAAEVGGDYYDILPTRDGGFWLGIGDVSGHGLDAGLVMLMLQSGLSSLLRSDAWVDPVEPLCILNRAVYDNVRRRLGRDDFATLSLFRFFPDGRFLFAGAHEEILIWRSRDGRWEQIEPSGVWIGALERIESRMSSRVGHLHDGDLMLLFTDGIVEARGPDDAQFDITRLIEIATRAHAEPASEICRRALEGVLAWAPRQDDDRTIVVVRRGTRR
jgi:predicted ATPase/serine phosphatase RsbU (regulator of sigma subunit)